MAAILANTTPKPQHSNQGLLRCVLCWQRTQTKKHSVFVTMRLTTRKIALEKGTDDINDGLPLYLGHVLGIWHNKHPWRRFFIDGHDVPAETEMVWENRV